MPDSFGNTLPEDFSNSFSNDLSIGTLNTPNQVGFAPTIDVNSNLNLDSSNVNGEQGDFFSNLFSGAFTNDQGGQGWLSPTLGAASGVAQTFLGFQQLSEGKKQNRIAQNQWQQQFDIQKGEYDRRTAERNARVVANNARKTSIGG